MNLKKILIPLTFLINILFSADAFAVWRLQATLCGVPVGNDTCWAYINGPCPNPLHKNMIQCEEYDATLSPADEPIDIYTYYDQGDKFVLSVDQFGNLIGNKNNEAPVNLLNLFETLEEGEEFSFNKSYNFTDPITII